MQLFDVQLFDVLAGVRFLYLTRTDDTLNIVYSVRLEHWWPQDCGIVGDYSPFSRRIDRGGVGGRGMVAD